MRSRAILPFLMLVAAPIAARAQNPADAVWQDVGRVLRGTAVDGGGYVRYNFPRNDLKVTVGDVTLAPGHAPAAWAGFAGTAANATMMGDMVCTESELAAVLKGFSTAGIDVTAIHDHFNGELPRLAFVHYHATGSAADLARRVDGVLALTKAPRPAAPAATGVALVIDSAQVFDALGKRGKASGSVATLSFMLVNEPVAINGVPAMPALAYGTPIAIQQISPSRAVASGDFSVLAAQVQPILRALAAGGISATSVHNHLVGAVPNVYYIHFWGDAPLPALLKALRSALDAARK